MVVTNFRLSSTWFFSSRTGDSVKPPRKPIEWQAGENGFSKLVLVFRYSNLDARWFQLESEESNNNIKVKEESIENCFRAIVIFVFSIKY